MTQALCIYVIGQMKSPTALVIEKWLLVARCTLYLALVGKGLNILSADFVLGDLKTIVTLALYTKFH